MRSNIYYFSKLFFPDKIGDKYIVDNFINEIWKTSDEFIIDKIISIIEKWGKISNINISINIGDYNKLLNFFYSYKDKIFNERKLLPSTEGDFNYLKDLYYENKVNDEIKKAVSDYIELNLNGKLIHKIVILKKIIKNLKIIDNDFLIEKINNYLKSNKNENNKFNLSQIIIKYLPQEEDIDSNNEIIKKYNDIRNIYHIITEIELKNEILETKHDSIWINVENIILDEIQKMLNGSKIEENDKFNSNTFGFKSLLGIKRKRERHIKIFNRITNSFEFFI